jgi:hypothetical protein
LPLSKSIEKLETRIDDLTYELDQAIRANEEVKRRAKLEQEAEL